MILSIKFWSFILPFLISYGLRRQNKERAERNKRPENKERLRQKSLRRNARVMIPVSTPSKCHNSFPSPFLLVPAATTKSSSLTNLHLQHRYLARRRDAAAAAPAVFLRRNDELRRSTSASFSAARERGWDLDDNHNDARGDGVSINGVASHSILTNGGRDLFRDDRRIFQQRPLSSSASDLEDSTSSQSSSAKPIEKECETGEETGIQGILSRLEKERSYLYSVESDKKENRRRVSEKAGDTNQEHASTDAVAGSKSCGRSAKEFLKSGDNHFQSGSFSYSSDTGSSYKPETWRMWSAQRAGFHETEFEAEGIVPYESGRQHTPDDSSSSDVAASSESDALQRSLSEYGDSMHINNDTQNFRHQIYAHIQQLQSELTSVLHILRTETGAIVSDKTRTRETSGGYSVQVNSFGGFTGWLERGSSEEMRKLSDAWEFQQTEIMKSKDQLRSTRAKLVVLEGKMALKIFEAQKMVEERQKRIKNAHKALNMLRTTCIIWPTAASKVFLVGSFDGWASQRRMIRSTSGIFSLNLKLYPGRYEIKFIVDGIWRIDPLRPVVHCSGYENNLLIIS
ncbi:hypothetical protein ACLOJK_040614 [Asimina triloba]